MEKLSARYYELSKKKHDRTITEEEKDEFDKICFEETVKYFELKHKKREEIKSERANTITSIKKY